MVGDYGNPQDYGCKATTKTLSLTFQALKSLAATVSEGVTGALPGGTKGSFLIVVAKYSTPSGPQAVEAAVTQSNLSPVAQVNGTRPIGDWAYELLQTGLGPLKKGEGPYELGTIVFASGLYVVVMQCGSPAGAQVHLFSLNAQARVIVKQL